MKRLLIISSDKYPPYRVDVKGLFGRELCGRGYKIDWILQSDTDRAKMAFVQWCCGIVYVGATNNGGKWHQRLHKHILSILNDCRFFTLDLEKYDIIQVKDKFLAALFVMLRKGKNGVRFVYWLSYPIPEASIYSCKTGTARYPLFNLVRGHIQKYLLYRIIMPAADHIVVQSEQMRRDIHEMGVPIYKMTPVPMGISDSELPADVDTTRVDEKYPVVLYLGTLMKVRRIDFVIRVFGRIKNAIPTAKLILVGDGAVKSDVEVLKSEMLQCNIDQNDVEITGFLPRHKALEYIIKSSVCLSPFYPTPILNSTSPTKLIEYMSYAKPVVANDHPEQRMVLEESGGGICVSYNEDEFAQACIRIINDRELASTMGKKGRDYVEHRRVYSKIADIVDDIYSELVKRSEET